jgi:hypothetical protein
VLQAKARVCAADRTSGTEGNCCANLLPAHPREGPRRVRSALAAGLWRRAAGGLGLGGASVGRGRGVEAVASTSMAENITVTVLFTVTVLTVFSSSVHTYLYA